MQTGIFKVCPTCSKPWNTLEDFLSDPELELTGYQVNFAELEGGLFYFTHEHETCGTTLAIPVKQFTNLSNRPFLALHGEQPKCCPNLCMRAGSMDPCPVECECGWVREIMQLIRNWTKRAA